MRPHAVIGTMVLLLGLLLAGGPSPVQAANYLGEFCWQSPDGGVGKFAVTDMGDGHFLLNGKIIQPAAVLDSVAFGNAEVVGSQVYLLLTSMGSNTTDTWAAFNRVVLDLATLNGTLESINVNHSKTNPTASNAQTSYDGVQPLTFVPCP